MNAAPKIPTNTLLQITIILLLGFAVLISGLLDTSLWADEGWTIAATAESNLVNVVTEWVVGDVHPPLFFINLSIWRSFTGDSLFELRYFSVIVSMLGIAITYRAGRSLFGRRAGLLAALFYSLHDLIYVLTHEVRHYPQQVALSALAIWLYARFYKKPSLSRGVAFALGGAVLLYTHYWGGFVLLAPASHSLVMWLIANYRHMLPAFQIKPFVYTFGGMALLYAPWLPVLYHQITLERPGGLPHALDNTAWVYAVLTYQLIGRPELFWVVFAFIGAMGAFALSRWKPSPMSLIPALVAVLTPALSIALNTVYPTLSFRALAVVVPAVILLAAHGLAQFRLREQYAVIVFVVLFAFSTRSADRIDRPDWPAVADTIITQADNSDVVLLENDTDEHALVYHITQIDNAIDYAYTESIRVNTPENYPAYLGETLFNKNGVWVAKLGWPPQSDIRPELLGQGWVQTAPEWDYGMYNDRPILLWRLDQVPDSEPIATFGDLLKLFRVESRSHDYGVTINMLWATEDTPERDYTVSVFLRGDDGTFRNVDSAPLDGRSPTTSWQPDSYYFDSRLIPTADLPTGRYEVGVQVYSFTDASFSEIENLSTADCSDDPDCRFVIVGVVSVD